MMIRHDELTVFTVMMSIHLPSSRSNNPGGRLPICQRTANRAEFRHIEAIADQNSN
jgi:hypothetical protein